MTQTRTRWQGAAKATSCVAGGASLPACKPGSVEANCFGRSFLCERSHLRPPAAYPRRLRRRGLLLAAYSALLRLGFAVPPVLPRVRWALTPPFHPYPRFRGAVCFLWHFPSPWVPRSYLAACPWSPDFPRLRSFDQEPRPSGRENSHQKPTRYRRAPHGHSNASRTETTPAVTLAWATGMRAMTLR